ncbi:unnamed protein product [Rhizophagus irregularis]|uniref:Uncharacterized protein n=1 Tax=Rhizophagus irregularis TaxID=588596 RepID=A0A2I1GKJ6_9GLOM|nr:hypothetical protein RhiirA4_421165 [Rhizophagus irregularis]CAB4430420.1 unnamed protein product [Rhizophagus irregularis]CAB4430505.1 unnamed protein product [Rhizophagus irregularis]
MELDSERNKNTENEEIINENPFDSDEDSDENSDKVFSGESDDEYFSEESNEEPDEEPDISEKIIDESLKNEHMPHISGEFALYFSIMEALMFCWIQKHNI